MQASELSDHVDVHEPWGFPLYEANFGWGKPVLVAILPEPPARIWLFLPYSCGKSGRRIEALSYFN